MSAARVLIASSNPWSFALAVERQFAHEHANAHVDLLDLWSICARHSPHWSPRDRLIEQMNRKIARFVKPAINGQDITREAKVPESEIPLFPDSMDELRSYEAGGAKIGLAFLSSVSSLTTIQYPLDLTEYGGVRDQAWRSAHLSLRVGKAVRSIGYDRVVIFNGRHCYSRPFCDVLEQECEVIRYEQGSAGNRYISNAGSVHHPEALRSIIETHDFDQRAGEDFFRERLEKAATTEVRLITATQRDGTLPAAMQAGNVVAFFTTSSDEMFAINDDQTYGTFTSQQQIASALSEICRQNGLQLIIRLHPHLRFKHSAWKREWNFEDLQRGGVLVLQPEDPADSYAILRASRAVVTTGSTIAFEASYLNIPNAVVGIRLSGCLGASVVTNTPQELANFVSEPRLPAGARERALMFGSFHKTAGKLLPELDVGINPNLARLDGRVVDPVRYVVQKLRFLFRATPSDPSALDVRSGMQAGRVLLPPGTDYSSVSEQPRWGKSDSPQPTFRMN